MRDTISQDMLSWSEREWRTGMMSVRRTDSGRDGPTRREKKNKDESGTPHLGRLDIDDGVSHLCPGASQKLIQLPYKLASLDSYG